MAKWKRRFLRSIEELREQEVEADNITEARQKFKRLESSKLLMTSDEDLRLSIWNSDEAGIDGEPPSD
jgi:hypothetical protein